MNYSVSHFLTREKNKLVNHPFIAKRAFKDVVFLWNTVPMIIVSAGALKKIHFIFKQKYYDNAIF